MALDTTYRGEDRLIEFQIVDSLSTPVDYSSLSALILLFYNEKNRVIGRYTKNAMDGYELITLLTDPTNGIFQTYLTSEMLAELDPSRVLRWEIKVKQVDNNSPDGFLESIVKGELTIVEESLSRNISI